MPRPPQEHANPQIHKDQAQPLALRVLTVAEARAALEAHLARCPGTHLECYGDPAREAARQRWIDAKGPLETDLELALKRQTATWKPVPPPDRPVPQPAEEIPMAPPKKSAQERLTTMLARLDRAIEVDDRRKAGQARSEIKALCEAEGLPLPDLRPSQGGPVRKRETPPTPELEAAIGDVAQSLGLPALQVEAAVEASTYRPDGAEPSGRAVFPDETDILIRDARALVWTLLGHLECMEVSARKALVKDLQLLESASATALLLAQGQVA
jgi:hypothetical protein